MKSCPPPLARGQPDRQTTSEVIFASFKGEILDHFQSETVRQSGKGWDIEGQINKRMPSCFDVSYPYRSIPINTYPHLFASIQISSAAFLWSISGLKPGNIAGSILATCHGRRAAPLIQVLWHVRVLLLAAIGSNHQRHLTLCSAPCFTGMSQKIVKNSSWK